MSVIVCHLKKIRNFANKMSNNKTDMVLIERIKLQNVRNIQPMEIPLSATERKHLIITSSNGSEKTALINDLKLFCREMKEKVAGFYQHALKESKSSRHEDIFNSPQGSAYKRVIEQRKFQIAEEAHAAICLTDVDSFYPSYMRGEFLICSFDAHRKVDFSSIRKVLSSSKSKNTLEENVRRYFVQMLVNFRARRSFANDDKNVEPVNCINDWFQRFEKALAIMLDMIISSWCLILSISITPYKKKEKDAYLLFNNLLILYNLTFI